MRKFKVLHLLNYLDLGGLQENTLFTVAHLDRNRYDVALAASCRRGRMGNQLVRDAQQIPDLKLIDIPHLTREPHPINDVIALGELYRLMRRERFDIVHTHAAKAGVLGRLAAKVAGVPIIIHSSHGWSFQALSGFRLVFSMFRFLEWIPARLSDKILTVTKDTMRIAVEAGIGPPDQFAVVYSGMPLSDFFKATVDKARKRRELGLPAQGPLVGTVMIMMHRKRPADIVRAAPKIRQAVPDTHFLLVGDGEAMPDVRRAVQELGLQDKVTLTGIRRDVPEIMCLLDVFVHPAWTEVLPRTVIQAMATGTPVVVTDVGGIGEAVSDGRNGFLVPPKRLDLLADAILRLLQDPELAQRMGETARQSVSSAFEIQTMVEEIEAVYEDLIKAKGLAYG
jgi:glycosyltransferase involved in cell wall biosynthesis